MAAATGWNDEALMTVFRSGLQADVQTELACHEDLKLDQLITMAIRLDNLLHARPGGSGLSKEQRLSPWMWARRIFPPRNVNPAVNRVSAPTAGSRTTLEHLSQKKNQARKRQAEVRSCTFPGRRGPFTTPYPSPCPGQPSPRNRIGAPDHDSHFPHSYSQPP